MALNSHEHRESPEARLASPEATLDLRQEITALRAEPNWQGAHNAKTLVKRDDLRVVLVALKAAGRMDRHQAPGPITIHCLEGRLRIQVEQRTTELGAGQVLFIDAALPHDVEALDQSAFLLTIAWPKDQT
ncbi:MAG TPA: cupin domain-containing protein [Chloroflexota bacterium]|jgi:quercetin dioxygenase-like cupin family protein|nr:cupin domain-containing protein [Chloroflexota bacterium]